MPGTAALTRSAFAQQHHAADLAVEPFLRAWSREVASLQAELEPAWIAEQLARFDLGALEDTFTALLDDFQARLATGVGAILGAVVNLTAQAEAERLARTLAKQPELVAFPLEFAEPHLPPGLQLALDRVNPEALRWIERYAFDLIAEATPAQIEAIRKMIYESFDQRITPQQTAIRLRAVIGLHSRQIAALQRFARGMDAAGLAPEYMDRQVVSYAGRLHRERATTIARTETIRASAAGREALWAQAIAAGYLPRGCRKRWSATRDGRAESRCMALDRKEAEIGAFFTTNSEHVFRPPLHPRCRCAVTLVLPNSYN